MFDVENIKLAIQAAWQVDEPTIALTLALREFSLRGLCLRCTNYCRRLVQTNIWLICRQCHREGIVQPPLFVASIYTPPRFAGTHNSIWLDTTNMRAHAAHKSRWRVVPNEDELFELLGTEPEPIHRIMSSYASTIEAVEERA